MASRAARERFTFDTPAHLMDAARRICVEEGREYPYLAIFHVEDDGTYRPFDLFTVSRTISRHYGELIGRTGWDVDWIDRGYAYHQSSGGGSLRQAVNGVYWRHPDMEYLVREETARYTDRAFRKRNKTRRLRRVPGGFSGHDDLMAYLEREGIEGETYYCAICEEYLLDEMGEHCSHVWWCDSDGIRRGPGSQDEENPCSDADCSCQEEAARHG